MHTENTENYFSVRPMASVRDKLHTEYIKNLGGRFILGVRF